LKHFVPTETFVVKFTDENAIEHDTVVMRVAWPGGPQWYLPPNGEVWARSLRILKDDTWLAKQLSEAFLARTSPLPKTDSVDVILRAPK